MLAALLSAHEAANNTKLIFIFRVLNQTDVVNSGCDYVFSSGFILMNVPRAQVIHITEQMTELLHIFKAHGITLNKKEAKWNKKNRVTIILSDFSKYEAWSNFG